MFSELFAQILKTYQKHGWVLRRVLLSDAARADLAQTLQKFPQVEIYAAKFDAMWFSRITDGREAWEIRSLNSAPFALCASFEIRTPEAERESIRGAMQQKIENRAF